MFSSRLRRAFRALTTMLLASAFAVCTAGSATAATAPRKSVSELTPAELTSLRKGVRQMMDRNGAPRGSADYRRSWAYWANMHAHFGDDCDGPVQGPGMDGVTTISASNADEAATWCKCEHGAYGFLTWHRMYLYYFEQVLQSAAGDPNLRLPYWDYATDPKLPAAFRETTYLDSGVAKPNPLYVAARNSRINDGTAGLDPAVVSSTGAFRRRDYWIDRRTGFSPQLEQAPHGAVHCALGVAGCQTGLMGAVPAAALDPIFYLHHANIDRLYDCWLRPDPARRLPADAARLNDTYSFPDSAGTIIQRRVGDMLESARLGYAYTRPAACPPAPRTPGGAFQSTTRIDEYAIGGPASIGTGITSATVTLDADARAAVRRSPFQTTQPVRQDLAVVGLTYDRPPASLYKVYLVVPGRRAFLGTLNFFSAGHAMEGHRMAPNASAMAYDALFPATEALAQLGLDSGTAANARLEFVAATGVAGETAADGERLNTSTDNLRYQGLRLIAERRN